MDKLEHILATIAEECNETAQRATKAMRFGIDEIQSGQSLTNAQRIVYEFSQLYGMMEMLKEHGYISEVTNRYNVDLKKRMFENMLEHSVNYSRLKDVSFKNN